MNTSHILKQPITKGNIIFDLQDYMFTSKNIQRYTKHMIQIDIKPKSVTVEKMDKLIQPRKQIVEKKMDKLIQPQKQIVEKKMDKLIQPQKQIFEKKKETIYKPKQKDSLFWCFYILKNGFSNYEMEINNQYFIVEKNEKFKYIEILRKNKDQLKIHKIKPLTELEDDLANKDKISIKTFFALCMLEHINILLVNKRKVYELLCTDIDNNHPINIVYRNGETYEHSIQLDVTEDIIKKYRETYYKMSSFDATLKSIGSYKLEELLDLCKKLDINIDDYKNNKEGKKKLTKKDIYELLVLNY